MKIETCTELYYTIRSNFHPEPWGSAPARPAEFKQVLTEYGAILNTSNRIKDGYLCDYLGISPGIDVIEFHDEKSYVMFLLRWS